MSTWSWYTKPLIFKDKCPSCPHALWGGGEVVEWNGGRWHVGCLLDKLTSDHQEPYKSINPAEGWGAGWGVHPKGGPTKP